MESVSVLPALPYTVSMRRRIVILLPFLAVVLMGGQCEFRATTGTLPPPEKREGERGSDGGLLVAVDTGGTTSGSSDTSAAIAASRTDVVQAAVAASVLELPALEPGGGTSSESPRIARLERLDAPATILEPLVADPEPTISRPVPEPGGLLLFALGGVVVGWAVRRRS